jgi:hypothetical protein
MLYGLFTLRTLPMSARKAAAAAAKAAGVKALDHKTRDAAERALAAVPEQHRAAFEISEHGYA